MSASCTKWRCGGSLFQPRGSATTEERSSNDDSGLMLIIVITGTFKIMQLYSKWWFLLSSVVGEWVSEWVGFNVPINTYLSFWRQSVVTVVIVIVNCSCSLAVKVLNFHPTDLGLAPTHCQWNTFPGRMSYKATKSGSVCPYFTYMLLIYLLT